MIRLRVFLLPALLLLVLLDPASGQVDVSFPDSAAAWTNAYYFYPPPPPGPELTALTSYCATGEDTLLFELPYKKIDTCDGGYKGAIRVLGDQVYFVPKDSLEEYLLYDFGLVMGDTARNVYMEEYYGGGYVTDVRIYGDESWPEFSGRRVLNTGEGVWIEGIGAFSGLFMNSGWNVSKYAIGLYCMSRSDTVIFGGGHCPVFLGIDDLAERFRLTVVPNPTNGMIRIRPMNSAGDVKLRIYTSSGTEVFAPYGIAAEELRVDFGPLDPGLYLVEVTERGRRHVYKVVRDQD